MLNLDDRLIKDTLPKIKPNALAVLLAISIHLNKQNGTCFPSHRRLMELTGLTRGSVYAAMEVLKKEGLLKTEQSIDSKSKTFGKRVFRVPTRMIKIWVDAEDAEPLPISPDTAPPDTAEPDTVESETYLLNKLEQLNQLEQLNKVGEAPAPAKNLPTLEEKTEKEKEVPPAAEIPAAAPGCYACAAGVTHKAGPDCDHYEPEHTDFLVKSIRPERPNVTEVEALSIPDQKQDIVLDPFSKPGARTGIELLERMRAYFMMHTDEWLINVLEASKANKWPDGRSEECMLEFCLYKEKTNDMHRTFNQYRADLTLWFIRENGYMRERQSAAPQKPYRPNYTTPDQPSPSTYMPTYS